MIDGKGSSAFAAQICVLLSIGYKFSFDYSILRFHL